MDNPNTYVVFKDPATGNVTSSNIPLFNEPQAGRALAENRGADETALYMQLMTGQEGLYEIDDALSLQKVLYEESQKVATAKDIVQEKEPLNPILIAIAAYLVFLWLF